jgi:hypothetical protein
VARDGYTTDAVASTDDDDDFFTPENKAKRRAAELERIAEIKRGWERMDNWYDALPPEERAAAIREEALYEAERERDRIKDTWRSARRGIPRNDPRMEIINAEHIVAEAAWCERWGYLWPEDYREPQARPGFIYPVGHIERLKREWLEEKITGLQILREAQLILEIHELRNVA